VNFRPVLFPVSTLSIRTLAQLGKFLTDGLRGRRGQLRRPSVLSLYRAPQQV